MITENGTRWECYLSDANGTRIEYLDPSSIEVIMKANDIGAISVFMGSDFDVRMLLEDRLIEVYRGNGDKPLKWVGTQLVRAWGRGTNDQGLDYIEIIGPDQMELLSRRVVAYKVGTSYADKTDNIDDIMKAIVRENMGSGAIAARDLSSQYFTVGADQALAPSTTRGFSYRNVLNALKDLADDSEQQGMPLYFKVIPRQVNETTIGFGFDTSIGQPGSNRSTESDNPTYFGLAWKNIRNPYLFYDTRGEFNHVYVGGQGEENRTVTEVSSADRVAASPYNRKEIFADARSMADNQLTGIGRTLLTELAPHWEFTCVLLSVPECQYGEHWEFGDRVTVKYADQEFTTNITSTRLAGAKGGESVVEAKFKVMV